MWLSKQQVEVNRVIVTWLEEVENVKTPQYVPLRYGYTINWQDLVVI